MKKGLFIITGLLLCVAARGQPLFSKMVSHKQQGYEVVTNIFPLDSHRYLIGGALYYEGHDYEGHAAFSAVMDDTGEIESHQVVRPDTLDYYVEYQMGYEPATQSKYFFGVTRVPGLKAAVLGSSPAFPDFFDSSSGISIFYRGHVHENHIVGCGVLNLDDIQRPFLVSLDSFGQERWRALLHIEGQGSWGSFTRVRQLTDTSFVAVGAWSYYKYGENEKFTYQPIIAAFTYSGRLLWQKTTGHHKFISLGDVVVEEDGSLVVCGRLGTPQTYPGRPYYTSQPYWQGLVYKIDPSGNLVWEVVMPEPTYPSNRMGRIVKLESGDYLAIGEYSVKNSTHGGAVVKISSEGEAVWYRRHENDSRLSHTLEDVVERENGGFIAVGHLRAGSPGIIDPPQQMWLLGLDSNGCTDPEDCFNWGNLVKVSRDTLCPGMPFSFRLEGELFEGTKVAWDFGDGKTDNSGAISFNHSYTEYGTYTITATISTPKYTNQATASVYVLKPPFNLWGRERVTKGELAYYNITLTPGYKIEWEVQGGGEIVRKGTSYIGVQWPDSFSGKVILHYYHPSTGCGGSYELDVVSDTESSIPPAQANGNGLRVYPNPASSEISISLPETFGGDHCQLAIYDMQGRLAAHQTVIATPGQPISYSTAHLPNGLYMVRINMGEKTAGGRLVVGR